MAESDEKMDISDEGDNDVIAAIDVKAKVRFNDEDDVKEGTLLETENMYIETIIREEDKISRLKTIEEISEYSDVLMNDLGKLEKMKKQGCDKVYLKEEYGKIDKRFELLNEAKKRLESRNLKDSFRGNINKKNEIVEPKNSNEDQRKPHKVCQEQKRDDRKKVAIDDESKVKIKIYNYLEDMTSHCDMILLFHCCTLKHNIENYLIQISDFLKDNNNLRLKVCYMKGESKLFMSDSFLTYKSNYNSLKFAENNRKELKDIRNDFISLDWAKNSTRLLCNIAYDGCKHDAKNIEKFIYNQYDDPVQELMDYNKISNFTFYIKKSSKNDNKCNTSFISNIEEFFNPTNFNIMLSNKIQSSLMEHVYNLKRNYFNDYDEFKKYMKSKSKDSQEKLEKSFSGIVYARKDKIELENIFDPNGLGSTDLSSDSNDSIHKVDVLSCKSFCSRTNLLYYVQIRKEHLQNSNTPYKAWIEKYNQSKTAFSVFDIHLVTRFFVKQFNAKLNRKAIIVSDSYLLKKNTDMLFVQNISYPLEETDMNIRFELDPLSQAFMHFTYEESKETMVVFDLRTIKLENDVILLTEPIIFCSNLNRFGMSNLGQKALKSLMQLHKCGSICNEIFNQKPDTKTTVQEDEKKKFSFPCSFL